MGAGIFSRDPSKISPAPERLMYNTPVQYRHRRVRLLWVNCQRASRFTGIRPKRDGAYAPPIKIFLLFPLSCQSDKEERQPGMTRRSDNQE